MAILLPQRHLHQPQYKTPIDYEGLGKGIQFLFNPALGPIDLATGREWVFGGDATVQAVSRGKVFNYPGASGSLSYTGYPEISGAVGTFFIWCPEVGPKDDWGHMLLYGAASGGYYLAHQFGRFYFLGSESDRNLGWFNDTNKSLVCASSSTAGSGLKVYQNGTNTGMLFSTAPVPWASGTKTLAIGKNTTGTIHDFNGTIRIVGYTTAVWGEAEAKAFHANPNQLFKATPRRIFSVASITEVIGTSATTNANDTCSASGTAHVSITGTVAYTNIDDTSAASGTTTITGSAATTNANDTLSASGTVGASAQFASDTFTDTDGVTLQAHDANWTRHPSYADNILIASNRAQLSPTASSSAYYHSATPSSADYSVSIDIYVASYSPNFNLVGVIGRASTSANTFYHARHSISNGWQLYRFVAGAVTQIGSTVAHVLTAGNTYRLTLDMTGSTIKLLVDGVTIIESVDPDPILPAGKAGLRAFNASSSDPGNANALHIDNFSADEVGGSSVTGTVAVTNANDTSAAQGTTTVTGSSATTNANDTSTATGSPVIEGSVSVTNADDTASASGSVGSAISGTVAYTNINDTADATGTTTVTGSAAVTNASDTASATGTTTVTGTSATTNADDTCAASGEVIAEDITGTVAYTNADDTASANGTTTIVGSAAATNVNDTLSAYGIVNAGIVVETALTTGAVTTVRLKKPGIPTGTADWLKTTLEIIIGRRGNKIEVPKFQTLTFSATPTKEECEALYSYANEIRGALNDIIIRLDS